MYNEKLKQEFLKEKQSAGVLAGNYITDFNKLGVDEDRFNEDISFFSTEQLIASIDKAKGGSIVAKNNTLERVKIYTTWCQAKGIEVNPDILNLKAKNIKWTNEGVYRRWISSPEHLDKCLDSFLNKIEDNTLDNIYRVFAWMAFMGIPCEDTVKISNTHVDLEARKLIYNKVYDIPEAAVEAFKGCDCDTFIHKRRPDSEGIVKERASNDSLLRGFTEKLDHVYIRKVFGDKVNHAVSDGLLKVELSYERIMKSGIFYRYYIGELHGESPNFVKMADIMKKPTKTGEYNSRQALNRRKQITKIDYEGWKTAYKKELEKLN